MNLTQFKVSWGANVRLIYTRDEADARHQVGAPQNATVEKSYLSEKDLMRILLEG